MLKRIFRKHRRPLPWLSQIKTGPGVHVANDGASPIPEPCSCMATSQFLTAQEQLRLEICQFALQQHQYEQQCVDSATFERHCRETLARMESLSKSMASKP